MGFLTSDIWWQQEFSASGGKSGTGLVSSDGETLVEIRTDPTGIRSLRSGAMQLAVALARRADIRQACLVLVAPRLSRDRLFREWQIVKSLFAPGIARRLAIVAVAKTGNWIEPETDYLQRIAKVVEASISEQPAGVSTEATVKHPGGAKQIEIIKVLLCRWLRREGAIPIGKLAEIVGCTYPTVAQTLKLLDRRHDIMRHSNRSVELSSFPQETWNELAVLSNTMRRSLRYVDASGESPDPQSLLERLKRMKPPRVALGGIAAARFWHSDFDLHGTPRLDLALHAPHRRMDLEFVRQLDPALTLVENSKEPAVLVIHPLLRPAALFENAADVDIPYADPVETTLDLLELGLNIQANELLNHFRREIRLP